LAYRFHLILDPRHARPARSFVVERNGFIRKETLALEGLLVFDERDKSYSPGPALAMLVPKMNNDERFFQAIRPELANVARQFSCTASFWRLAQERLVLIDSVRGAATMNVHMDAGFRLPALLGAMGRCIAGYSTWDRSRIESAFRELNWQNPPSFSRVSARSRFCEEERMGNRY